MEVWKRKDKGAIDIMNEFLTTVKRKSEQDMPTTFDAGVHVEEYSLECLHRPCLGVINTKKISRDVIKRAR